MKKFIDWLTNSFAPSAQKFFARPYIAGVSSAMVKVLPFILTGSLIYIYQIFVGFFPSVFPDLTILLKFSFRMLGLITAFLVPQQTMEKLGYKNYAINAGITGVLVFLVFMNPQFDESGLSTITYAYARFGPTGMFGALSAGLFTTVIFHFWAKLRILENNTSLPDFISDWFRNILPILTSVAISTVLVLVLNIDIFNIVNDFFKPISNFAQTLPGFMLLSFLQAGFFTLGVSPWVWGAIRTPIFATAIAANIAAVAAGQSPEFIVTYEVMFTLGLLTLGGQGSPLPLVLMMLKSKSKKLRQFGKVVLGPAIFNISEPIMYGLPVVFNPIMMIPMWINSLLGAVLIWVTMKANLLAIPSISLQTGSIPAPISSFLITQDWRSVIWWFVFLLVYGLVWYPFFKVLEKQKLEEEIAEIEANQLS